MPTNTESTTPSSDAPSDTDHYTDHVVAAGDQEEIVLSEDLYSSFGVLLLRKGSRVNNQTFSALSNHTLTKSIDDAIAIEDCVTNADIFRAVESEIKGFPAFAIMSQSIANMPRFYNCLRQVDLHPAMRNKISIAKKTKPEIFEHAIRVAITSVMLGMYMGLSDQDCDNLAVAGLFHDLGEMHIDPALLDKERSLSEQEMKFVYAHPAIIYNILVDLDGYKSEIATAIFEHHERIGGHGYPRGIEQYSNIYGAVLAVAEVLTSMCESYSLERTIVTLKYNHGHFDKSVLNAFLKAMLNHDYKNANTLEELEKEQKQLISIISSQQISLKHLVENNTSATEKDSSFNILKEKLKDLPTRLYRSGIEIDNKDPLKDFKDDPESSFEAMAILEETLYMMRDFHRDFSRRMLAGQESNEAVIKWHQDSLEQIQSYKIKTLDKEDL